MSEKLHGEVHHLPIPRNVCMQCPGSTLFGLVGVGGPARLFMILLLIYSK